MCNTRKEYEQNRAELRERKIRMLTREVSDADAEYAVNVVAALEYILGPMVELYPTWHPIANGGGSTAYRHDFDNYNLRSLYNNVPDHTICFANGFLTCPYDPHAFDKLCAAADRLNSKNPEATIEVRKVEGMLYHAHAYPVLVFARWDWNMEGEREYLLPPGYREEQDVQEHLLPMVENLFGTVSEYPWTPIPLRAALYGMAKVEIPQASVSQCRESWSDMRYMLLGSPHYIVESPFVTEATGRNMRKQFNLWCRMPLFGPKRTR